MQMIKSNKDHNQRLVQKTIMNQNQKLQRVVILLHFYKKPGNSFWTEVFSPAKDGSDNNSDGPTVLQTNPPLSGKTILYHLNLE